METDRPEATGLKKAGKALEESFFAKENDKLLADLREEAARAERRSALREAMALDNEQVIDALLELDVLPETVAAFSLVPLIEVAWADGEIHQKERAAILKAAEARGIEIGSANHDLLESWLNDKPEKELMDTWKTYAHALHESLDPDLADALKDRMVSRARSVAEAAGGFLGLGAVSPAEQAILDELDHGFD
jgi:hypothetical protein